MQKIKFIHAADLHIESPYRGVSNLNPELGERLIQLGFKAFDNLIEACIVHEIDFLLIAGDSFDSENASLSAQFRFLRGLQKLTAQNIPVYIVCGNHDPLSSWIKEINLPEHVHVFQGNEVQQAEVLKEGKTLVHIYGVSFEDKVENRSLEEQFRAEDKSVFSIGLLHGTFAGIQHKNPYCPMTLDQLKRSGMHYWALGHIHKREVVHELKPTVIYPGNLQGRHFNETGKKGAYVVEVDDKNTVTPTFISLSEVVFLREEIMLTEDESLPSLSDKIEGLKGRCIDEFGSVLLRLTLKGNTPLYEELRDARQLNTFADTLNEGVNYQADFAFISRIENKTQPLINWEERKQGDDFVADLIRKYEAIQADDTTQQEIIQSILEEIDSSQVYRKLRKYDLDANFSLEALIDLAKTRSITALIADKRDH